MMGTGAHVRQKTMSDITIWSSKVARKAPGGPGHLCLICPRMPETVWILTPSKRATSMDELNMSLMNAVFLKILKGCLHVVVATRRYPTSFSFFTTRKCSFCSSTVPVAAMRNSGVLLFSFWMASRPVLGGTAGP